MLGAAGGAGGASAGGARGVGGTVGTVARPAGSAERVLARDVLEEAVRAVVGACDPVMVVCFGSVARGEDVPGSDLDLLVVLEHVADREATRARVREAAREAIRAGAPGVVPDVLVYPLADVDRYRGGYGHVVAIALREGKVVYRRRPRGAEALRHIVRLLLRAMGLTKADSDRPERWLSEARLKLECALLENEHFPHSPGPAFQSAFESTEKSLKALYLVARSDPPKSHDLAEIAEGVPPAMRPPLAHEELERMTELYPESRYPADHPELGTDDAAMALRVAGSACVHLEGILGSSGPKTTTT